MRTKGDILQQVGELAIESPRSGIIPDLADAIMIEVLIDIRDILAADMKTSLAISKAMSEKD